MPDGEAPVGIRSRDEGDEGDERERDGRSVQDDSAYDCCPAESGYCPGIADDCRDCCRQAGNYCCFLSD